ncbi:MAG TPA: enoyl-CoA hydratase/isomerase family protein [Sphingomonadales bacterium]|nr:enoyl-CoA hydratase/isomerase family protein [Sphingomonadales bacterium]
MKREPAIRTARTGSVARLTLNRAAARNAITLAMWKRIADAFRAFSKSKRIRFIIVDSAAPGIFSAGADLKEFTRLARDRRLRRRYLRTVTEALRAITKCPAQTVALVSGPCYGGGLALAAACGMRLASSGASFAVPAARIGLVYPLPEVARLVALVGQKEAAKFLLTARAIGASEAARIGLVNVVLGMKRKGGVSRKRASGKGRLSPYSLHAMKRLLALAAAGKTKDTRETEKLFLDAFEGADFQAALQRFNGKS